MKNLESQICTTMEQSKRLLKLGVKPETADMLHYKSASMKIWGVLATPYSKEVNGLEKYYFPAWSLHRLIAMLPNVIYTTILSVPINYPDIKIIDFEHNSIEYLNRSGYRRMFYKNKGKYALYNNIIDCIEWLIQEGHFNKEYLKEK